MSGGYCPECGAEHGDVSFCPECGFKIGEQASTETETSSASGTNDGETDAETVTDEGGLDITLGKIVSYIVGPLLILLSLGGFIGGNAISGILLLIAGIITLPFIRSILKEQQGITLSRWATVGIVLILVIAGIAMVDTSGAGGTDPVGEEGVDQDQALIDKPATELVIQLNQLGSGWSKLGQEGNETHAYGEYFHTSDDVHLNTTADRYDSVETAAEEYESRVDEVQEQHGTESVNVGDEAIVYSVGDLAWVIFRDSNVVAEVQYLEEYAFDLEGEAIDKAELMHENFRS